MLISKINQVVGLLISFALFNSCVAIKKNMTLPGKIALYSSSGFLFVYSNADTTNIKFKIRDDKDISYGGFTWMNKKDFFIGTEYIKTETMGINRGNIACFNLNGNIVDRIYESKEGEIAGNAYLTRDDKLLLFTIQQKGDVKTNPFEGLTRTYSIVIMDFSKKKIIKKIENIGIAPNFELDETPWLYDGSKLIYNISGDDDIVVEGLNIKPLKHQSGVYIYDIDSNQKELLVADAHFGICSPLDYKICYIKDQSIWLMDLKSKAVKLIYKGGANEKISNIHWTPDGKYIYLVCFNFYLGDFFKSEEKVINVKTGEDVPFKKIGNGYYSYTWK